MERKIKIREGIMAPNFVLPDQNGKKHSLTDFRGRWVLLYFYPKDDTPGCTKEACSIRDLFPDFRKLDAEVLGISIDSVARHKKFVEKYQLPFTLLADTEKKVVKKYGVWAKKKFPPSLKLRRAGMGREYMSTLRSSFLIDPKGKVAMIYEKVTPESHAQEVLRDLAVLKNR